MDGLISSGPPIVWRLGRLLVPTFPHHHLFPVQSVWGRANKFGRICLFYGCGYFFTNEDLVEYAVPVVKKSLKIPRWANNRTAVIQPILIGLLPDQWPACHSAYCQWTLPPILTSVFLVSLFEVVLNEDVLSRSWSDWCVNVSVGIIEFIRGQNRCCVHSVGALCCIVSCGSTHSWRW